MPDYTGRIKRFDPATSKMTIGSITFDLKPCLLVHIMNEYQIGERVKVGVEGSRIRSIVRLS